jgi:hypothetical protein
MLEAHPGVETIDAFMAAQKHAMGADDLLAWQPGRNTNERVLRLPLEVDGEQHGQTLLIKGFPRERGLKFRIGINFPPAICRVDFANEIHPNSKSEPLDYVPRIEGPHYHSWPANRRFFTAPRTPLRLHNAIDLGTPGRIFDAVLRWFCEDVRIQLPANHTIELPRQETLL